jgi:hypothetical protein
MDWQTVFDQLLPTDQWYVATVPLANGYARLTWTNPNQTERYGIALMSESGEVYGTQIVRASSQPQILRLPAPLEPGPYHLALRPWNLSAFALPVKVEVDGDLTLDDNNVLLERLSAIVSDSGSSPNVANLEAIAAVAATDYLLVWRDGQLKRLLISNLSEPEPEIPAGTQFVYQSDGDTNDVFHWIGTNYGAGSWEQPTNTDRLEVTSKTPNNGYYSDRDLTNRVGSDQGSPWLYQGSGDAWIQFNLKTQKIILSGYSIRNGSYSSEAPRNWKIQGSNDAVEWTDLDVRSQDTTLQAANSWVTKTTLTNPSPTAYQHLRIYLYGGTASGSTTYCLSEFQVYGIVPLST